MVVVVGHRRQAWKTVPTAAENGAAEVENLEAAEAEAGPHYRKKRSLGVTARRWKKMKNGNVATTQVAAEPESALSQKAAQRNTQPQTAWKQRLHVSGKLPSQGPSHHGKQKLE